MEKHGNKKQYKTSPKSLKSDMEVTRTQDQTDKKDDHEQPKKGQPCIVCSKIKHTPLRNLPCSTVQKHNHPCRQNMQKKKQSSIVYMKNQDVRSNQASRQPDSASSISVHFPSFSFFFFLLFFFPHSLQYYLMFYPKCTTQMEYLYYIYICTAKEHDLVLL